ncbi:hypothetical protein J4448_02110 [Candidatus Woesearchaeota archaeon]|nr:hypothetical protein [Candidatus Woesearchaeota archaeon]
MGSSRTIRNIFTKSLVGGLCLGTLAVGARESYAQETQNFNLNPPQIVQTLERAQTPSLEEIAREKEEIQVRILPERRLVINFDNPVTNSESNTNAWYSAQQVIGKVSDHAGIDWGLDNNLLGRIGILGLQASLSEALNMSSHELAHTRTGKGYGPYKSSFSLKSIDWPRNFSKEFKYVPTLEQRLEEVVAGLNQDELNAFTLFRYSTLFGNKLNFDEGIAHLQSKFWDVLYNLRSREISGSECNPSQFYRIGDVSAYICSLNMKGIDFSKKDHLVQALLADLLSAQTYDSFRAVYEYLRTGQRSIKPTVFEIKGIAMTPPLISHYLTSNGSFYDIISIMNPNGENPVELNFGMSVPVKSKPVKTLRIVSDKGKGFRVEEVSEKYEPQYHLRIGAEYHNIRLGKSENAPRISPFMYLTMRYDPLRYSGISAGTEFNVPISPRFELTGKADYSRNDIMENTVKGKNEGFNFSVGLMGRF